MKLKPAMLILPLALIAGGCQTWGPTWSEVSGERYNRAIVNRQPAVIESIDGNSAFPTRPIKIEPGRHVIIITGVSQRPWPGGGTLKTMTLDLKPCMRYYLNAQFQNPVDRNYTPVIDFIEPIAGCRVTGT